MDENGEIIFRGHLDECLRDLGERFNAQIPKGSSGAEQAKKPLADFCGVSVHTVRNWLDSDGSVPVGEEWIKLICYLDLFGYKVIEFERMKSARRNFMQLIGFGLLTTRQATDLIGYKKSSSVFQVLRGKEGTSKEKDKKIWNIWKENKNKLEQTIGEARKKYALPIQLTKEPISIPPKVTPAEIPSIGTSRKPALVEIMSGLSILLEQEEINALAKSLDPDAIKKVLKLSSQLSSLSSVLLNNQRKEGA